MAFESQMTGGYPAEADIDAFLAERGLELVTETNPNFIAEFKQFIYGLINAFDWANVLGVYCPSTTTFNVRGGKYLYKGQVKTYTPSDAVDPIDNDTTYIWLAGDNTIDSGIDGDGWPADEHIKLAEIDVDSDGIITEIRDLRGQSFMQYLASYVTEGGTSVEVLPVHWDSATPADNDEVRIPIYAENDASEKIEYARLVVKLTDVSDGAEAAEVTLSKMIAGSLTSLGELVGTTASQLSGKAAANIGASGGLSFVLTATLTAGNIVQIHNSNAPFKYRIIDAWSIAKSADGGTWKLTDGTNDITDVVTVTGTDKTIDKAGTIDDAYNEIAANGSLSAVGDGANADCDVYVLCVRVS